MFEKFQIEKTMNSHKKFEGKLKKILKIALTVQNTRFSTEMSRQQDTKSSRQNTQRQNFEKIL